MLVPEALLAIVDQSCKSGISKALEEINIRKASIL